MSIEAHSPQTVCAKQFIKPLFKPVGGLSSELELKSEGGGGREGVNSPFYLSPRPSSAPLFSHPCRPEEGVFYGKHGPPGSDRGSKLITGLPELSQQAERRGETFGAGEGAPLACWEAARKSWPS